MKIVTQVTSILEDIFNMASLVPRIAQVIMSTSLVIIIMVIISTSMVTMITIIMMMIRVGRQPTWRAPSSTSSCER